MAGAIRRFPFLADAEAIRLVCHPDAMTPDANPLLGPLPGVRGFWVAAGLSLNGFGGGGGIGRAMAGWITAGDPGVDIGPYRAWRFGDTYRDPGFAAGPGARDVLRLLPASLPVRRGPRRPAAAAVGAPRPAPGGGRGVRDEGRLGAGRLPRAGAGVAPRRARPGGLRLDAAALVRARRAPRRGPSASGRASIDLSSFGKIAVEGPGALGLLQRVSANDIDRPVGSVVYTQWCDERGGMVADVTVTRLADDRFRVVTGRGLPRVGDGLAADPRADDEAVTIRDVSGDLATIGLWGPRARDVLVAAGAPADEVGNDAHPDAPGRADPGRAGARPRRPHQLRRRTRLGADDARSTGP